MIISHHQREVREFLKAKLSSGLEVGQKLPISREGIRLYGRDIAKGTTEFGHQTPLAAHLTKAALKGFSYRFAMKLYEQSEKDTNGHQTTARRS